MKLASYELSLLAKDKGFDKKRGKCYCTVLDNRQALMSFRGSKMLEADVESGMTNLNPIAAPHLYDLVDWLREEKGLIVTPFCSTYGNWYYEIYNTVKPARKQVPFHESYYEALSAGITKAMEL